MSNPKHLIAFEVEKGRSARKLTTLWIDFVNKRKIEGKKNQQPTISSYILNGKNSVSLINCNFLFIIFVKSKHFFSPCTTIFGLGRWLDEVMKMFYKIKHKHTASKQLPVVSNSIFLSCQTCTKSMTHKNTSRENVNFSTDEKKKENKTKSGSRSNRRLCDKCQNTMTIKIAKSSEIIRGACHRCGIVT